MDFLTIGHLTRDLQENGYTLGGTATYASLTALRLGRRPGILTRVGADIDLSLLPHGIEVQALPGSATTTFRNVYLPTGRRQYLMAAAEPLGQQDVPARWLAAPIVLLGPVAQEVEASLARLFRGSLLGAIPQGWMRSWNSDNVVHLIPWTGAEEVLPHTSVVVVSEEDLQGDPSQLERFRALAQVLVLTQGARGCTVFRKQREPVEVPPRPAHEVDPTGAGDVFTAAFLIRLHETGDALQAARFANVTASFSVEAHGTSGIPTRAQVEDWLATTNMLEEKASQASL